MPNLLSRLLSRDVGQPRFCYMDYHADSHALTTHYGNLPTPGKFPAGGRVMRKDEAEVKTFLSELKTKGWQQYHVAGNREGASYFLMQAPVLEAGYDYCALSIRFHSGKPEGKDLYRLGTQNERIAPADWWEYSVEDVLQYLTTESWVEYRVEELPIYGEKSKRTMKIALYRRAVQGSSGA